MRKLSNDELAENIRASNRRRSERQRQRRLEAGKAAFTVWLPAELQQRIAALAAAESATISAIVARALEAAMQPVPVPVEAKPDVSAPVPAKTAKATRPRLDRTAEMSAITAWLETDPDMPPAEWARRLTEQGHRAANGSPLRGANLARDYERWKVKQDKT